LRNPDNFFDSCFLYLRSLLGIDGGATMIWTASDSDVDGAPARRTELELFPTSSASIAPSLQFGNKQQK
jgi:hypothetical protein